MARLPRMLALGAAGAAVAFAALAAVSSILGSDASAEAAPPTTATASVARRDLVQRSTVSGTLGYGDPRVIVNYRQGTITLLPEEGRVLSPVPSSTPSTRSPSSSFRAFSPPGDRSPRESATDATFASSSRTCVLSVTTPAASS